jgi:hypothetical protein
MCDCPERHHDGATYYASVISGTRVGLLAGPFADHAEALAILPRAKEAAEGVDPRAFWYAFGTLARLDGYDKPGVLNDLLGIGRKEGQA